MKRKTGPRSFFVFYFLIFSLFLSGTLIGNRVVTVISESSPLPNRRCIIIDAGHGGVDGGATSCTGVLESKINLEIALRLDDLFHLLGYKTCMIRTTDVSVYTEGESIAAKKVSDLKQRVKIANNTENAILVSIHQNHFSDSRYYGPQVFYPKTEHSRQIAETLQKQLIDSLSPTSNRSAKNASGVYLLEHISCPGILIECGFLSNPEEETKLRSKEYQKQLCITIGTVISRFISA